MLQSIDHALFSVLNRGMANGFLDAVMPVLTGLHHTKWFLWVVGAFAVGVLAVGSKRARVWVLCAIVAVGLSDLCCARVAKRILPRDRPCSIVAATGKMTYPDTRLVGECPGSKSFPSNHASNMMAVGLVCWWFTRGRKRWAWMLLPLVIGYSRVYLGYHYPFDMIGGWGVGALIATGVLWAARPLSRERPAPHIEHGAEKGEGPGPQP